MGRLKLIAAFCALLLALGGCAEFFTFNAFGGIDPVKTPAAADYEGPGGLDALADDLESPAVVDAMTDQTIQETEEMLNDDYVADGVDTEEDQEAAVLLAELNLVTTGGDEVVNNIVNVIMDYIDSPEPPADEEIAQSLSGIIPPEAMADPEEFADLISGFMDANDAYTALGSTIDTLGVPEGVNMGDVAQKAVVAFTVATVVDTLAASLGLTEEEAIGTLYGIILDPESASPEMLASLEPPDLSEANPDAEALLNIFEAIGLDLEGVLDQGGNP